MTVKVVLFDFDGTLADTLEAIINIANRLSSEFGYKKASQEEIDSFRDLNSMQIIKTSGIPLTKLPFLIQMVKLELNQEIKKLKPVDGIQEMLESIKNKRVKTGIVTSNSRENVKIFLEKNDLNNLFDVVYSGSTLFGKSKVIKKFLRQESLQPEEVIYVGDETRDIEAAKKIKLKVVAVSWGFNSKEVLAKQEPDFAIDHPQELIAVIERLQQSH